MSPSIAVLIPCHDEEASIARVICDFRKALPGARICVFDNNSTDRTVEIARAEGAEVWFEPRQGKGNVVRRMFSEIEADIYLLVDGDATYDAASAGKLIRELNNQCLDMVVGRRQMVDDRSYRAGHQFGNRLLTGAVAWIFGRLLSDILSGYRVFSRRFVKSFPAMAMGFEIETELTIHSLQLRLPVAEVDTPYFARPEGSRSKLNTYRDGFKILGTIIRMYVLEKPFQFFSILALLLTLVSSVLFIPVVLEYFTTGLVPRFPRLIVAVGGYVMALVSLAMGTLLHTVTLSRLEVKRFKYLESPRFIQE